MPLPREPYWPKYKNSQSALGSESIESMPPLAFIIGRIVANWRGVELNLALCVGSLTVEAESARAVSEFLASRDIRTRHDALRNSASANTLDAQPKEILSAILRIFEDLHSQYEDVLQGLWGWSNKLQNAVIWTSVLDESRRLITAYGRQNTQQQLTYDEVADAMVKDWWVVAIADLETLNRNVLVLANAVRNFHFCLRHPQQSEATYKELVNETLVREALIEIRSASQND